MVVGTRNNPGEPAPAVFGTVAETPTASDIMSFVRFVNAHSHADIPVEQQERKMIIVRKCLLSAIDCWNRDGLLDHPPSLFDCTHIDTARMISIGSRTEGIVPLHVSSAENMTIGYYIVPILRSFKICLDNYTLPSAYGDIDDLLTREYLTNAVLNTNYDVFKHVGTLQMQFRHDSSSSVQREPRHSPPATQVPATVIGDLMRTARAQTKAPDPKPESESNYGALAAAVAVVLLCVAVAVLASM